MPINSPDVFNPVGDATVSGGGGGGAVDKIVAGTNVTISPVSGIGDVTINSSGGGGGGTVTSVTPQADGVDGTEITGVGVINFVGSGTVTTAVSGDTITIVGTPGVTGLTGGTGMKTNPISGITSTGTIGIANTGVVSARYITGTGGHIDVNDQGQITGAVTSLNVTTIEVAITDPTVIAPSGSPITIATAVTGKIFIPLSMICLLDSGTFTESTKQSLGLFYDASANSGEPIMTAGTGMFNLANGNERTTVGLPNVLFDMTSAPTTKDLELASSGGTFVGNWTGIVIVTGIYHTKS